MPTRYRPSHLAQSPIHADLRAPTVTVSFHEQNVCKSRLRWSSVETATSGFEQGALLRHTVGNEEAHRNAPCPKYDLYVQEWAEALVSDPKQRWASLQETLRRSLLETAGERWLQDARDQLANLDAGAREEGLEPPSAEAREFAEKFILEFAKSDLPLATIFADENRGVSIQMEVTGFFFLLTCFKGGSGLYNIAHETYRFAGSYKSLSKADFAESELMRHLRCWIKPLSNDARDKDRAE